MITEISEDVEMQSNLGISLSLSVFLPATTTATDAADATSTSTFPNAKQLISHHAAWPTSDQTSRSPSLGTATSTRKTSNSVTAC